MLRTTGDTAAPLTSRPEIGPTLASSVVSYSPAASSFEARGSVKFYLLAVFARQASGNCPQILTKPVTRAVGARYLTRNV